MTTDGFLKSAQRLSVVSSEDRAWVLSMLETEDRIRLMAAMRDLHSPDQELDAGDDVSSSTYSTPDPHVNPPAQGESDRLSNVDSESMRLLLSEQPDWVCALLVADARWPWVEEYLASIDAERLLRLETLVRRCNTTVRPRVRTAVAEIVNRWLSEIVQRPIQANAFDLLLERLRQNDPAVTVTESSL